MAKNIYTYYRDRLTRIGGDSKSLCLSSLSQESACDVGKLLSGRGERISEFTDFLFSDRKKSFTLISKKDKKALLEQLDRQEKRESENRPSLANSEEAQRVARRNAKQLRDELKKELEAELLSIKAIKSNCEDIERDTGRNELFIGFPFVFGTLSFSQNDISVKAPLLLFPVRIEIGNDETVVLRHDIKEKILINPAFISAYSFIKKTNTYSARLEFDSLADFGSLEDVIKYLKNYHVKIDHAQTSNIFGYSRFKEPAGKNIFSTRYGAVLSRFSITQSIYNDYMMLERKNETNEALSMLTSQSADSPYIFTKAKSILGKIGKAEKQSKDTYTVEPLDFRQAEAVRKVGEGKSYVINTPPFTRCASVAAGMIADAICKRKKVLLVSDKKTALDTIYNTLGPLRDKCVYINDESTERERFYRELYAKHERAISSPLIDIEALESAHNAIACEIKSEEARINSYFDMITEKRQFGISMLDMYSSSSSVSQRSPDHLLYEALIKEISIMALDYTALSAALLEINESDLANDYYEYITEKETNPIYGFLLPGIDSRVAKELRTHAARLAEDTIRPIPASKYPYYRCIMANYSAIDNESVLDSLVKQQMRINDPKKRLNSALRGEIKGEFLDTLATIREYSKDFEPFRRIFTKDGYTEALSHFLAGSTDYIKSIANALSKYERMQILDCLFYSTDKRIISILDFALKKSKDKRHYREIIEKILPLRIYHELIKCEETYKSAFLTAPILTESKEKILRLDERKRDIAMKLISASDINLYASFYLQNTSREAYLNDISREDSPLPIRRLLELHEELITALYPCWLLTPENVSMLLPLKKNLFDLVIFDGASQMFVEEALPATYRAKAIAVMGDGKQIHPSAEFMRRCLGNDITDAKKQENGELHTESLYDIAAKNLPITKLTYNYGGEGSDFISFSNRAFYSSEIVVAPHIRRKQKQRPIEMRTVCGGATDGKCANEAEEVIEILRTMAKKKRSSVSIGVITFSKAQHDCIAALLDDAMLKSEELAAFIAKEKNRTADGEDASFFIKTVENAQGDRRDIIILSPALSKDDVEIGSNNFPDGFNIESAINVSITRAKQKFILVSSISPDAVSENGEASGKIYEKFLSYVKAAAAGTKSEIKSALSEIGDDELYNEAKCSLYPSVSEQISEKLCRMGYTVRAYPGGKSAAISLAVYDEKKDKYLVGIMLDCDILSRSDSALEREVYYPSYLTKAGWTLIRVTSREWWHEPKKVITTIIEAAEYNRSDIKNT